jgi:hypothetical protein
MIPPRERNWKYFGMPCHENFLIEEFIYLPKIRRGEENISSNNIQYGQSRCHSASASVFSSNLFPWVSVVLVPSPGYP